MIAADDRRAVDRLARPALLLAVVAVAVVLTAHARRPPIALVLFAGSAVLVGQSDTTPGATTTHH